MLNKLMQRAALQVMTWTGPCPCGQPWSLHTCPKPSLKHPGAQLQPGDLIRPERHCEMCGELIMGSALRQADGRWLCATCKALG